MANETKARRVMDWAAEFEKHAPKFYASDSPQGRGWFSLEHSWSEDHQRFMWQAGLRKSTNYEGDGWIVFALADDPTEALEQAMAMLVAHQYQPEPENRT